MPTEYYQKNREKLQKKARERYQNLSEEKRNKNRYHGHESYQNVSEGIKKQKATILSRTL